MSARISFLEAINEPLLFQKSFDSLSKPQQVALKIIYGLSLSEEELPYWHAFNGGGEYDELGYLTGCHEVFPYNPREYQDITLIVGRRSGKTSAISSFVVAYEALCGGHKAFLGRSSHQDVVFLQVAQDLETAKANVRQFILQYLEDSPVGKATLGDVKQTVTADTIRLKGCGRIVVGPPTIKLRSQAVAVCAMDELAVWPKDRESANPDSEVQRAVTPALLQFPYRKLIKTSTPMTEEGLLWTAAQIGTQGRLVGSPDEHRFTLVIQGPTALFENPVVKRADLRQEKAKDSQGFSREFLSRFAKSVSGFINTDLLRKSVTKGVTERQPKPNYHYVATLDPAFRNDAFAFCIGHMENSTFVLDVMQSWRGTKDVPVSPTMILSHVASYCRQFGIKTVISDQHHLDSLQELAQQQDLTIEPAIFNQALKKMIWGDFNSLLNQGRVSLLDHSELIEECAKIEKHLTPSGGVQIYGARDDHAVAMVLCCHRVLQLGERIAAKAEKTPVTNDDHFWHWHKKKHKQQEGGPWWA